MTQILARFHRHQQKIADEQKIARIVLERGGLPDEAELTTVSRATLPGDTRRLRGIPVAGGACGTSPGTDPYHATVAALDNVRRARYRDA